MSDAIKQIMQRMWGSIDYSVYANLTPTPLMSERLCEAVDLRAGHKVLDVATGSGNTAIAAARRWCTVTGIDYVMDILGAARRIAGSQGVAVTFQPGDAENLEFPDGSFDAVLSTLGVMFAPDQKRAAGEMVRVCKRGGRIGVASWTPHSLLGQMFRLVARYAPPPAGAPSPLLWGTEQGAWELFGDLVSSLDLTFRTLTYRFQTPRTFIEWLCVHLSPLRDAFTRVDESARKDLFEELVEIARRMNRSGDDTLLAPARYLQIVAVR